MSSGASRECHRAREVDAGSATRESNVLLDVRQWRHGILRPRRRSRVCALRPAERQSQMLAPPIERARDAVTRRVVTPVEGDRRWCEAKLEAVALEPNFRERESVRVLVREVDGSGQRCSIAAEVQDYMEGNFHAQRPGPITLESADRG